MAYEQKDGSGALFRNGKKESDSHPDYNGSITVGGVSYWLNAWIRTPKAGGAKFMSLSVKPKQPRAETLAAEAPPAQNGAPFNDEVPF